MAPACAFWATDRVVGLPLRSLSLSESFAVCVGLDVVLGAAFASPELESPVSLGGPSSAVVEAELPGESEEA